MTVVMRAILFSALIDTSGPKADYTKRQIALQPQRRRIDHDGSEDAAMTLRRVEDGETAAESCDANMRRMQR